MLPGEFLGDSSECFYVAKQWRKTKEESGEKHIPNISDRRKSRSFAKALTMWLEQRCLPQDEHFPLVLDPFFAMILGDQRHVGEHVRTDGRDPWKHRKKTFKGLQLKENWYIDIHWNLKNIQNLIHNFARNTFKFSAPDVPSIFRCLPKSNFAKLSSLWSENFESQQFPVFPSTAKKNPIK